ncbi:DUF4156 domain-containing protein [Thiomicrorhabdus immobilis]|nr:DUF4156 domain-containing protein [Thiomicrorhabdus immobilis]
MKKILLLGMGLSSVFLLSACSWIQPLPGAFNVALLEEKDVTGCTKLGTTTSSVLSHVGLYDRDTAAIKKDLILLAKNEAVNMRGDTIVAISPLQDGRMEFAIYDCVK